MERIIMEVDPHALTNIMKEAAVFASSIEINYFLGGIE